jgi:hypothetical protein
MPCSSCGAAGKAARALASGEARKWTISLADGTTATVSSQNEADRLQREARARMARKGYTARQG